MAFEDDADHELHAETNKGLVFRSLDVDCVRQLDDLLEEACLNQAVQNILVGHPVQFDGT